MSLHPSTNSLRRPLSATHRVALGRVAAAALFIVAALATLAGCRTDRGLRLVLAATPDTAQTESYRALLAQHFPVVEVIPLDTLATADLSGFDVLIVDGTARDVEPGRNPVTPPPEGITIDTLSLPTVLIGGTGAMISDNLDLKLGWRYG